ncbi:MAG: UDP-N-acetylmuramate dehydrogenase [Acidaminococcaceae bacterium]|nr:UDP-N-acetylmuramate dehydrogenase [Acidaminococcaceae bacterium]
MSEADLRRIFSKCTQQLFFDEPMSGHTSFRIGGIADVLATPADTEELIALLQSAQDNNIPVTLIGNGSNLLVRDGGIRGLVIKLGNALKDISADGRRITFGSGLSLAAAAGYAAKLGLTGMEFAAGIPGSIGGAVYMNAGAYDGEMKDVVISVTVVDASGKVAELDASQLEFSYRKTSLQSGKYIVTAVTVELSPGNREDILAKISDFAQRRISKQPLELPSAGSTFKRPPGYFAGTLIEQTGLKGYSIGGAQVSLKHAGFIVNTGGATASDVLRLIRYVQEQVHTASGVMLEPEVLVLGED